MAKLNLANKTILIVDDEDLLRTVLGVQLKSAGAKVFEAREGGEALEIYKNNPIDIILSDVRMPGMDGRTLLKSIRSQNHPQPTFVFITGFADFSNVTAKEEGANGMIAKPFTLEELRTVLTPFI